MAAGPRARGRPVRGGGTGAAYLPLAQEYPKERLNFNAEDTRLEHV